MIRTVSYKASIQADGSIYNESIEFGAEMDSMPLAQSQLDDAGARVDQLRQAILARRRTWEGAPAEPEKKLVLPPTDPSVLKDAPGIKAPEASPKAQATLDGSKPPEAPAFDRNKPGWNRCPKCGRTDITHEHKAPKTGSWQGCATCGLFLNANGTTSEMKPRGA